MDFLLLLLIEINCQSLNKVCLIYEVRLYYKAGERYAQMNDFGLILSGRNILYKQERAYIAYALFFLIKNALLMSL